MDPTTLIPNRWRPRPYQRKLIYYLQNGGLRADVAAHRRWGKDEVALHWTATQVSERVGLYWHMLPEAGQGRKAIWTHIAFDPAMRGQVLTKAPGGGYVVGLRC